MMSMLLLFSLFSVAFSQQLINLSDFAGGNYSNELSVPAPYSIYISANQDSDDLLSKIYIVNENGVKASLNYLKHQKDSFGVFDRYVIQKSSYLTTELTTDQMKTLKGVMFISSPKQVQDYNLLVIDINYPRSRLSTYYDTGYLTTLFLNTHLDTNPYNSAVISNWQQDFTDSSVFIYPGIPTDSIEPKNTQIFSNPMHIGQVDKFLPNVETFSLTMVAFYVKTYKAVRFYIEPGYLTVDKAVSRKATTTGFYMKPLSLNDSPVTINTYRDINFTGGSSGANIIGNLLNDANVTINQFSTQPKNTITQWSALGIEDRLTISSTPGSTGQYYVQYYVDQGRRANALNSDGKPPLHDQELQQ